MDVETTGQRGLRKLRGRNGDEAGEPRGTVSNAFAKHRQYVP